MKSNYYAIAFIIFILVAGVFWRFGNLTIPWPPHDGGDGGDDGGGSGTGTEEWGARTVAIPVSWNGYACEPAVIYDTNPVILTGDTHVFKCWYRYGWDPHLIGYAESADGKTGWTEYSGNPILTDYGGPCVIKEGNTIYLFVENNDWSGFFRFHSANGVTGLVADGEVMTAAANNARGIANPFVWPGSGSGLLNMVYSPLLGNVWEGDYATSSNNGLSWTPSSSNPVMDNAPDFVQVVNGVNWCWTHGSGSNTGCGLPTDIERYYSKDCAHWTMNPVGVDFGRQLANEGPGTNVGQVADPTLLQVNNDVFMWYDASSDGSRDAGDGHISVVETSQTFSQMVPSV